jgi:carboxyl-terminal processing protease
MIQAGDSTTDSVRHHLVGSRRRRLLSPAATACLALISMCLAGGCGGERRPSPPAPSGVLSPAAQAYLNELIALMEAHSVNRLKINWNSFRTGVLSAAGGAQSVEATFPAIQTALSLLGDSHSFYQPLTGLRLVGTRRACVGQGAGTPTLPGTVGYVKVGAFSGSEADATGFANALQRDIASLDRDGLAGWILDVRGNTGGNMWPMIAGVGPILGEGPAGYFIDPVGAESVWEYRDGASWENGAPAQRVDAPYRLRRASPKVAVLIDGGTASSGEAVVISFQRRPDTRSFGVPTCGLSTANEQYMMSDGASLFLTISVMADRTRFQYGGPIVPDEEAADPRQAEQRAVAWLQTK